MSGGSSGARNAPGGTSMCEASSCSSARAMAARRTKRGCAAAPMQQPLGSGKARPELSRCTWWRASLGWGWGQGRGCGCGCGCGCGRCSQGAPRGTLRRSPAAWRRCRDSRRTCHRPRGSRRPRASRPSPARRRCSQLSARQQPQHGRRQGAARLRSLGCAAARKISPPAPLPRRPLRRRTAGGQRWGRALPLGAGARELGSLACVRGYWGCSARLLLAYG